MTISYPITPPSLLKHSSIQWKEANVIGVSESPISLTQTIFDWAADRWGISVNIDPLTRSEAAPWAAFLSSLRGRRGTFWYGDELTKVPLGTGGGSPKVKGGSNIGYELDVDGFPVSTLVLKANDRFQIGNYLHKVMVDATTDINGEVRLQIWPSLRGSPADNADLILNEPKGIFRLTDNVNYPDDLDRNKFWNISFQAEEVI